MSFNCGSEDVVSSTETPWLGSPQVLPPLKDVNIRPEIGTTVRNKLVRLMTHVDMGVKQSAAEFLFVLCKESGE